MTPRKRSQDLTADLLHDLEAEEAAPAIPAAAAPAVSGRPDGPAPALETAVYLAPRGWRRPSLARRGRAVSISFGPLRVRVGRTGRG